MVDRRPAVTLQNALVLPVNTSSQHANRVHEPCELVITSRQLGLFLTIEFSTGNDEFTGVELNLYVVTGKHKPIQVQLYITSTLRLLNLFVSEPGFPRIKARYKCSRYYYYYTAINITCCFDAWQGHGQGQSLCSFCHIPLLAEDPGSD